MNKLKTKTSLLFSLLVFSAAQVSAQEADIALVLGDIAAIEKISAQCPGVYPDYAVMESTQDNVWDFAVATYGEEKAGDVLSSETIMNQTQIAGDVVIEGFIKAAGGESAVCDYVMSGAVKGFTSVPFDGQGAMVPPDQR